MDRPAALHAQELTLLRALAREFPNVDAAMAEIARLSAVLTLPKGTVHVISDIHGEDKKLRHVINNASGTLRPLVERLFADADGAASEFQEFLTLIFYPAEVAERLEQTLTDPAELRRVRRPHAAAPVRARARPGGPRTASSGRWRSSRRSTAS